MTLRLSYGRLLILSTLFACKSSETKGKNAVFRAKISKIQTPNSVGGNILDGIHGLKGFVGEHFAQLTAQVPVGGKVWGRMDRRLGHPSTIGSNNGGASTATDAADACPRRRRRSSTSTIVVSSSAVAAASFLLLFLLKKQ
jgi:hypothetical protein